MAWKTVTDVNNGQTYGGGSRQATIDAVVELQQAIGPDVPTTTLADLERQINPNTVTLNDDQAAYLTFAAPSFLTSVVAVGGNSDAAGSAIAAFRTGESAAFVSVMASDPPGVGSVTGLTSHLTGTTGADGNLAISGFSHPTERRLYLQNRTGGIRAYSVSFLSLVGGELVDGTWTIV